MTHQIEMVPFLAKYPIDKWEEEGAPCVSQEGWCELVMRVAKNKLDTLEAVFQAAKQTQTRVRHARGVKGDDVEDLRPGMLALSASAPAELPAASSAAGSATLHLVLRLRGEVPEVAPPPEPQPGAPYRASGDAVKEVM